LSNDNNQLVSQQYINKDQIKEVNETKLDKYSITLLPNNDLKKQTISTKSISKSSSIMNKINDFISMLNEYIP